MPKEFMLQGKKYFQYLGEVIRNLQISLYVPTVFSFTFSEARIETV